ncbi:YicC/YloC family endoribonuclease, partial [Salmonella sp. SAL4444]|uniref:YicC/YloC family endoribonuclease n=1 Tax=Salmonella sp. SAL4444 TaxID=3159899 RepID=UPI00397DC946
MHAPSAAEVFEGSARAMIKSKLARGHVDLRIVLPGATRNCSSGRVNKILLEEYLESFREAASAHGLSAQPDLNAALRIPGMF